MTGKFEHIILLTDFSDSARNAMKYAVSAFGETVNYVLVNAYYARTSSATLLDINDMLAKDSELGLKSDEKWMTEQFPDFNLKVEHHSYFGTPVDSINRLVNQENGDLVVMGTKGSSGINAVIYGSVASSVVRNTIVPVLSIPPDSAFNGIKKIVYATDGGEIKDSTVLEPIRDFMSHFESDLTVFSVEKEDGSSHLESMNLDLEGAHYSSVVDQDVQGAIGRFCGEENIDVLVLLPKHTGFFDRIFHKSITRKLVEKADLPILSLENR